MPTLPAAGRNSTDDANAISDDEGPVKKRMRVSRACEACRRRKERCDGAQPSCLRCTKIGRECSYNAYRKRGLRAGYVRGIEILLGLLIHSFDGAEALILSVLRDKRAGPSFPLAGYRAVPAASSLLDSWRHSASSEDLQKALVAIESEEDEESYLQNLDDRLTSIFNTLCPQSATARDHHTPVSMPVEHHSSPSTFLQATPHAISPAQSALHSAGHIPPTVGPSLNLPPNWSQLVETYLVNTHCWLPIVPKYTLFRSASLLVEGASASDIGGAAPGDIASLWAVFAYGSYQLESVQSSPGLSCDNQTTTQQIPNELHIVAKRIAVQDQQPYDAGHVHAFLILSLLEISNASWTNAWLWVGKAVYVAACLEIIPPTNRNPTWSASGSEKRLFLGCFILDTLIATRLNLRPHLSKEDLDTVGCIAVDELEEWEAWRPIGDSDPEASTLSSPAKVLSTFNHLGRFAALLNDLCRIPEQPSAQVQTQKLLDDLVYLLGAMPAFLFSGGRSNQISGPPHFRLLRVAAASLYVRLKTRMHGASAMHPVSDTSPDTARSILSDTLDFLTSTPKSSPIFNAMLAPPILNVFFVLLEQSNACSPDFHLRLGWSDEAELICSSGTRPWGIALSEAAGVGRHASRCLAAANERQLLPSFTAPLSCDQMSVPGGAPALLSGEEAQQNLETSMPVPSTTSTSTDLTKDYPIAPLIQHPSAVDQMVVPTTLQDKKAHDIIPPPDEPDGDGLFNQLSLLDTSQWSDISGDFMEHLGLSRDATLFDFQSLISP